MRKQEMALMDSGGDYAARFMKYANRRKSNPFRVSAFTDWEELLRYVGTHRVEVLLISEEDARSHSGDMEEISSAGKVILLTENAEKDPEHPTVFRYQACSGIIREVMVIYGMTTKSLESPGVLKARTVFVGVYSPVGRIGKSLFSRSLAEILSATRSTLFMDLQAFSGREGAEMRTSGPETPEVGKMSGTGEEIPPGPVPMDLLGEESDADAGGCLEDLLYHLMNGEENLNPRILAAVTEKNGVSCLPAVMNPAELMKVSEEDWIRLFRSIRRDSPYETVVLDLGLLPAAVPSLLEECDIIYMPCLPDHTSRKKAAEALACIAKYRQDLTGDVLRLDFGGIFAESGFSAFTGSEKRAIRGMAEECVRRDRL